MTDAEWPVVMEEALRGYLSRRCKRAYAHDMRNGLQGIFGGVDALARAARTNKPSTVPLEQVAQFVQQAITNHQRGLERVLDSIAPEETEEKAAVAVDKLITDLATFLTNDAARNGVRFQFEFAGDLAIEAMPAKVRMLFLALLTDTIDAMPAGGIVRISGREVEGRLHIDLADPRTETKPAYLVVNGVDALIGQLAGRIDRQQLAAAGYRVRVELPM